MTKLISLSEAIADHVHPGMHLNFASTPSRSNAAIRAVARRFRGTNPEFSLSATGFHSSAHLLGLLDLGRRYIACFFGDNYPAPRPNSLYQRLEEGGATLEHWSLWTYVSALRAAALGHPYAVTNSLRGSTLGRELARAGHYFEVDDPATNGSKVGLVRAWAPDIVFLHAPLADATGRALFTAPYSEGFHGALAARLGVILTVDRLVDAAVLDQVPHLLPLPTRRILAVSVAPFGAHPQPSFVAPSALPDEAASSPLMGAGYRDDYEHYVLWRRMTSEPRLFDDFCQRVLDATDDATAYRAFVGEARLERLRADVGQRATRHRASPRAPQRTAPRRAAFTDLDPAQRLLILAARTVADRIGARQLSGVLAGIGQAFTAARLAKLSLEKDGADVELMIETGIIDPDARVADPFILSHHNIAAAKRLASVDHVLGALVGGTACRTLGVMGSAQVDAAGNVNSTRIAGRLLVGSGGANDIASSATEIVVLAATTPERLVQRVDYVTSPGSRVLRIVTAEGVLQRRSAEEPWHLGLTWLDSNDCHQLCRRLSWVRWTPGAARPAAPPNDLELSFLAALETTSDGAGQEARFRQEAS